MVRRNGATAAFLVCLILAAALPLLAQQDTTPPVLTAFSYSPTQVDTTSTSANVNVTAQITDDLSGLSFAFIEFVSPSGLRFASAGFFLSSGTNLNGTYSAPVTIPAFTEPGTWTIYELYVQDNVGNSHYYYTADLQALGFPTTLEVTSQEDSAAPNLTGFSFSPTQVDTTSTSANVNVTAQITDDLSGLSFAFIEFVSPSGLRFASAGFFLSSGTNLNGTYSAPVTIPAFTEPGTWTIYELYVQDNVGNSHYYYTADLQALGFPTTLEVTSQEDSAAPNLTGFSFSPTQVDTTSTSANVNVTAQITDDLSGLSFAFIEFVSPSGLRFASAGFFLSSGTNLNGTYSAPVTIPAFTEPGTWTIYELYVQDNVGNFHYYYTADLQALGFPTTFQFGATTSVALSSSLNPAVFGQAVTFTASVTASNGTIPTGTVNFNDGTTTIGTGTLDATGTASFTSSTLGVGSHSVAAAYSGDTNFSPANSSALSQTISQALYALGLVSSADPSAYNQSVTFTATITPPYGGTATGTFTFSDSDTNVLGVVALSGNTATLTTAALSLGTHTVKALYSGDANFSSNSLVSLAQVVGQAATSVAVVSSGSPSAYNQGVTFTATVAPQYAGTASGSVTFSDGGSPLVTVPLSANQAGFIATSLSVGTHSITASYSGDASFTGSTSSAISQMVNQAGSTAMVTSSANPVTVGQPVTFTADVLGQYGGTPTGTVSFKAGSNVVGVVTLSGGQATLTRTSPTANKGLIITAVYSGDLNFTSSISPGLTQVVNKAATGTSMSSSLNPSIYGQAVSFTAMVTSSLGTPPDGELVTFKANSITLGTATLSGSVATFITSTLGAGNRKVTATYNGDSKLSSSTSTSVSQVISKATTTTAIASSQNPSTVGQSVTFTVTVTGQYGGTPTGTITFTDNGATLGTAALSGGSAMLTTSSLTQGKHTIKASYGGDSNFRPSSKSLSQTVN